MRLILFIMVFPFLLSCNQALEKLKAPVETVEVKEVAQTAKQHKEERTVKGFPLR